MRPEHLADLYAERYGRPVRTDRPRTDAPGCLGDRCPMHTGPGPPPVTPEQAWQHLRALHDATQDTPKEAPRDRHRRQRAGGDRR